MALFKISRGLNGNLPIDKKDGYCYYTTDNSLFHIDYEDDNHELQRKSLNAAGAQKILVPKYELNDEGSYEIVGFDETGAAVLALEMDESTDKIPTNALVSGKITEVADTKMDKENPTGSGYLSMNQSEGEIPSEFGVALGYQTIASGLEGATAIGYQTQALGDSSIAIGNSTIAEGKAALAEGKGSHALGDYSHAGGLNTHADGLASYASGESAWAKSDYSFAHGYYVEANGLAQTVFGKFNIADTEESISHALIIGGGSGIEGAEDQYKNIFTVDWRGNAEFTGTVKALSPIDENDLATKAYVDAAASNSVDVGMSHMSLSATEDGQTEFDFSYYTGTTIDNNTLIYFNGLLLIKGVHYTLNAATPAIVTLLDWSAKAGDYCHIVKFRVGEGGGVQLGGEATVTSASMLEGIKAYDNEGNLVEGTLNLDAEYENQVEVIDDIDALTQLEEILN